MQDKINPSKYTVLDYYPKFIDAGDYVKFKHPKGYILKFRFFTNTKEFDLFIDELIDDEYKERSLVLSFSFDNEDHINLLKQYYNYK